MQRVAAGMAGVLHRRRPGAGVNGVSPIDRYLTELGAALHVRGAVRRRFLRECRDHLTDAAGARGEEAAVRAFGPAAGDRGSVRCRGRRAAWCALDVRHGGRCARDRRLDARADPRLVARAPPRRSWWAIAFFVAAQLAAVAAGLALVQALVLRRSTMPPAEVALLARRNACALVAAGVTIFSAGAALPGRGSAVAILAGPALVAVALVAVLRTRSLARRLDGAGARSPSARRSRTSGGSSASRSPRSTPAASCWSRRASPPPRRSCATAASTPPSARPASTAGIEAMAVVGCFVVLGPALGLRRR